MSVSYSVVVAIVVVGLVVAGKATAVEVSGAWTGQTIYLLDTFLCTKHNY